MSLSVSYNQNFKTGIDTSSLREVTQQIFQRANAANTTATNDLSKYDLTKFNRASLGTDLYSGKVDSATARLISMTNSGMQVTLSDSTIASLNFLNTQASKSLLASVDGKVNATVNEQTTAEKKNFELPSFGQLTETADLSKDKRGSNPFYKGELRKDSKDEDKEESLLNLVA